MIDGTVVRAHQHAAGALQGQETQALGRSHGGFSTKIHAAVDSFGLPLKFIITGGEVHEMKVAKALISFNCDYLLADRGYDSNDLRQTLSKAGITAVIPGKKNRKEPIVYDETIYKERNHVERFFNRTKQFRRISSRFDKTSIMFKGALTVVAILMWLEI
jgi:transposase